VSLLVELALLRAELLIVVPVHTPERVLETVGEALQHHCNEHLQDHVPHNEHVKHEEGLG